MPGLRTLMLTCAVAFIWTGGKAEAQYRGYGYRPQNRLYAGTGLGRIQVRHQGMLSTLRSRATFRTGAGPKQYAGFRTRADRVRQLSPFSGRTEGLLAAPPPSYSPIRVIMERRNLLRSRSNLGSRISRLIGRADYVKDVSGRRRGDIGSWPGVAGRLAGPAASPAGPSTIPAGSDDPRSAGSAVLPAAAVEAGVPASPDPRAYQDLLATRLRTKADDYYELGASYLRNGEPSAAANCFEIVRGLESRGTRGFLADVFAAVQGERYNRALASLLKALQNAEKLEDLRIEGFLDLMFPGSDESVRRSNFRRTVDNMTALANASPDSPQANLLMAYFAWLDGHVATAITAAENAEKNMDSAYVPHIQKFRRFLTEAQEGRPDS